MAEQLTSTFKAIGTRRAVEIGLLNSAFGDSVATFRAQVRGLAERLARHGDLRLWLEQKRRRRGARRAGQAAERVPLGGAGPLARVLLRGGPQLPRGAAPVRLQARRTLRHDTVGARPGRCTGARGRESGIGDHAGTEGPPSPFAAPSARTSVSMRLTAGGSQMCHEPGARGDPAVARGELRAAPRERDPEVSERVVRQGARPRPTEVTAFIDECRGRFGVEPVCRTLGVSASAYALAAVRDETPSFAPQPGLALLRSRARSSMTRRACHRGGPLSSQSNAAAR